MGVRLSGPGARFQFNTERIKKANEKKQISAWGREELSYLNGSTTYHTILEAVTPRPLFIIRMTRQSTTTATT